MPKPIRVVIVDDHPVVREGLNAMLSTEDNIEVIGQASTGAQALQAFRQFRPDVMVLDLMLPDVTGAECIQAICQESSDVAVIVLTSASGDEEIYRCFDAGARGFLFKDTA